VPAEENAVSSLPDETIMAEAIRRTLFEEDITWQDLVTLFRLCGPFTGGAVRLFTQEATTSLFDALQLDLMSPSEAVSILEAASECSWIDPSQLDRWKVQLKTYCVTMTDDLFNQLDDFVPVAKWVSAHRALFTQEDFGAFTRLAEEVVDNDVSASYSPNDESIWTSMKDNVEILQDLVLHDFSGVLGRIEEKIETAQKPTPMSHPIGGRDVITRTDSVDALFDALLQ
jgi:hypothetical protein